MLKWPLAETGTDHARDQSRQTIRKAMHELRGPNPPWWDQVGLDEWRCCWRDPDFLEHVQFVTVMLPPGADRLAAGPAGVRIGQYIVMEAPLTAEKCAYWPESMLAQVNQMLSGVGLGPVMMQSQRAGGPGRDLVDFRVEVVEDLAFRTRMQESVRSFWDNRWAALSQALTEEKPRRPKVYLAASHDHLRYCVLDRDTEPSFVPVPPGREEETLALYEAYSSRHIASLRGALDRIQKRS